MDRMDLLKYLLALVLAAVFSIVFFTIDATSYHNEFNQVDVKKAAGMFVSLWTTFTVLIKMNPPGESQ